MRKTGYSKRFQSFIAHRIMRIHLLATILFGVAVSGESFEGKLYRLTPHSEPILAELRVLEESGLDFWSPPAKVNQSVEVSVEAGQEEESLLKVVNDHKIPCDLIISNVTALVEEEMKLIRSAANAELLDFRDPSFNFERYHDWDEINEFLDDFLLQTPQYSEEEVIGTTHEGRSLRVIKLSNKEDPKDRKGIWLDCGIHAREWISPAFCIYALDRIVNVSPELLDYFNIYVLPVVNPDGYVYSWESKRLWRKNRSPQKTPKGPAVLFFNRRKCTGADINRNFENHWNTIGSSSNPCLDTYHGKSAFSEKESSAIRDFLSPRGNNTVGFFTIHSYSQLIMSPFAYQKAKPDDEEDHLRVMSKGIRAIRDATENNFFYGSVSKVLTQVGGGSPDWAYEFLGVKYPLVVEMRDKGNYGFLLPQDQIEPATRETWMAFEAMLLEIAKEYV